jgi:hypothetical protein
VWCRAWRGRVHLELSSIRIHTCFTTNTNSGGRWLVLNRRFARGVLVSAVQGRFIDLVYRSMWALG